MPKTLDYSYVASSEITSAFVFGSIWSIMNLVNLQNLCSGRKFPSYHCTFISEELQRIEERKIIMIYSCKILKNRLE